MKGLLLKDFINLKRQSKIMFLLIMFYFVLAITSKNNSVFSGVILVIFAMLPITAISYDEKANWDKYGLTMPVSRVDMVLSKYILGLILSCFALIINFAAQIFLGTKLDTEHIVEILAMFGISLLFISFLLPIMFKYGVEKGRMMMFIVLFIPTFVVMLLPKLVETPPSEEMILNALYALPVVVIVIYILSILLSISIYKKKEF